MEYLSNIMGDETLTAIVAAFTALLIAVGAFLKAASMVVGALTGLVAVMKVVLPRLQRLADRTEMRVDNELLLLFGAFLAWLMPLLEKAKSCLEVAAGNRFLNEQVIRVEPQK